MEWVSAGAASAATIAVFGSLGAAPSAHASNFGVELNGTYRVSSNGEWARTNDVLMDEKMVVQTWTVTTSCVSPIECTGEVHSDQGWTAPLRLERLLVRRPRHPQLGAVSRRHLRPRPPDVPRLGRRPATVERVNDEYEYMAGRDITKTASGACGVNKPLVIELPVWIEKLS